MRPNRIFFDNSSISDRMRIFQQNREERRRRRATRNPSVDSSFSSRSSSTSSSSSESTNTTISRIVDTLPELELLTGLERLRESGTFCDIKIRAGDGVILAHRNVLCAASHYFNAMFSGSFIETKRDEIEIKNIDKAVMEILIKYMYTGSLPTDDEHVEEIVLGSFFLQIPSALKLCIKRVNANLNSSNCLKWLYFAAKFSVPEITKLAIEVVAQNLSELIFREEFLVIEYDEFLRIISHSTVRQYPEDVIYTLTMRWINHDPENRSTYTTNLLCQLNPCYITQSVLKSAYIQNSVLPLVENWLSNYDITDTRDPANHRFLLSKRIGKEFAPKLFSIHHEISKEISPLPKTYFDGSYVGMGYNIYHTGGWKHSTVTNEIYCATLLGRKWIKFVPLISGRAYHRSIAMDDKIYTIGGSNGLVSLPLVEVLDIQTGVARAIANLPEAKEQMGVAIHNKAIYCVGGLQRGKRLGTMHRYDPRIDDSWDTINTTPFRLGTQSCAVVNNDIFCAHSDALERYDIRANKWTLIHTQHHQYPYSVFTDNNVLYGVFKEYFAQYIPDQGKWKIEKRFKSHDNYLQATSGLFDVVAGEVAFPDVPDEQYTASESDGDDDDNDNNIMFFDDDDDM